MLTELFKLAQHQQKNREELLALQQQAREISDLITDCQAFLDKHRRVLGNISVRAFLGDGIVDTARRLNQEIEKELQR